MSARARGEDGEEGDLRRADAAMHEGQLAARPDRRAPTPAVSLMAHPEGIINILAGNPMRVRGARCGAHLLPLPPCEKPDSDRPPLPERAPISQAPLHPHAPCRPGVLPHDCPPAPPCALIEKSAAGRHVSSPYPLPGFPPGGPAPRPPSAHIAAYSGTAQVTAGRWHFHPTISTKCARYCGRGAP